MDATTQSYPARLREVLGDNHEVRNFGIGGATLIKTGRTNIWRNLDAVRRFQPHIAIISLGTNDTVGGNRKNWEKIGRFDTDYSDLIRSLAELSTEPRIVLCTPTSMVLETAGLSEARLANLTERKPRLQQLCHRIRKLAENNRDKNVSLLELNSVLAGRPDLLSQADGVHPNREGYRAIAQVVAKHISEITALAWADLRLSGIFSDHMVLQGGRPATVWGWADAGEEVIVTFAEQRAATMADDGGSWSVTLQPLESSGRGRELAVRCKDQSVVLRDVVVGDVWHASGQSNMAMNVGAVAKKLPQAQSDIDEATLPQIRFRRVVENASAERLKDLPQRAGWIVCSPQSVPGFSAAAFYFARALHAKVSVPIGIIDSSRGGTPIEPFIPRAAFRSHPTLQRELALGDQDDLRGIWKLRGGVRARDANWLPGRLFHSRIAPIADFAVRGAIWYQGESNCGVGEDPRDYRHKMRALIKGWRKAIGNDELPFYFVQLPGSGARAGWPYLREQQRLSADLPHTGMVVTIDLLDQDIHPANKIDVGQRLAAWALAGQYGKRVPTSGPMFAKAEFTSGKAIVHFAHANSGLMVAIKEGTTPPQKSPQTKLSHFELADETGNWYPAEAVIAGQTVIVRSDTVLKPVAVRYAYAVDPQHCHLYNQDGLPASPFCSDASLLRYEPELPVD